MDYGLLCPNCKKEPSSHGSLFWLPPSSMRRMDIPYFMCGQCRTICADKRALKNYIRWWKSCDIIKRRTPTLKTLYNLALEQAEKNIDYYVDRIGYRRARFIRKLPEKKK